MCYRARVCGQRGRVRRGNGMRACGQRGGVRMGTG